MSKEELNAGTVTGAMRFAPVHADLDRLTKITVCTRPFRAAGPRIEPERIGDALIIHNYGHGGSGWSLSWGSAAIVLPMALSNGVRDIAVIGCGALGITASLALQAAGARVTMYARELPPNVRSSRATGAWTPDARIARSNSVAPGFATRWEQIARVSYDRYRQMLNLPDAPIDLHHRYTLSEAEPDEAIAQRDRDDPIGFLHLDGRLNDLYPPSLDLPPGTHPFPTRWCRRTTIFRYNITDYSRHLLTSFRSNGGQVTMREFHSPVELTQLPQKVIVNCTGYAARALFKDESVIPIRGQIAWLAAQPELDYSVQWNDLNIVPRHDGLVLQLGGGSDATGWNDPDEEPDPTEAQEGIRRTAELYAAMRQNQT